jgi:hypothetical protein
VGLSTLVGIVVVLGVMLLVGAPASSFLPRPAVTAIAPAPANGVLSIQSSPSDAKVTIDGVEHGRTPLQASVTPGQHTIVIESGGASRTLTAAVAANAVTAQYIELLQTPQTGTLSIHSEPSGARVTVNGKPAGQAPVVLSDIAPGDHEVLVESEYGALKQTVAVAPGAHASLVVPLSATGSPPTGWIAVTSPVELQIREGGHVIGASQNGRILVKAGRHDLELANDALGFSLTRTVQVQAGKTAAITATPPQGALSVNATPWAEVWVDGNRIGETPVGNLPLPIGVHEIVFRHPQLGERRQSVTVTATGPARVSVDMRRQ